MRSAAARARATQKRTVNIVLLPKSMSAGKADCSAMRALRSRRENPKALKPVSRKGARVRRTVRSREEGRRTPRQVIAHGRARGQKDLRARGSHAHHQHRL